MNKRNFNVLLLSPNILENIPSKERDFHSTAASYIQQLYLLRFVDIWTPSAIARRKTNLRLIF